MPPLCEKMNLMSGQRAAVPVVCIGNFTLGGAGKTPLALAVADLLVEAGYKPVFLTRGYGGSEPGPILVSGEDAAAVGDEALLLARTAPTVVARWRSLMMACASSRVTSAVSFWVASGCIFPWIFMLGGKSFETNRSEPPARVIAPSSLSM